MACRQLRVFPTPEPDGPPAAQATVRIRLADLLPLIALAQRMRFVWLQDFLDDEVMVTGDLYEVMQAFRRYRPSA